MKKRGRTDAKESRDGKEAKTGKEGKDPKQQDKSSNSVALEDEAQNEGFGEWLRSSNGVELMRLFVIANSLVVFITMAWPNMSEAFFILRDFITGDY